MSGQKPETHSFVISPVFVDALCCLTPSLLSLGRASAERLLFLGCGIHNQSEDEGRSGGGDVGHECGLSRLRNCGGESACRALSVMMTRLVSRACQLSASSLVGLVSGLYVLLTLKHQSPVSLLREGRLSCNKTSLTDIVHHQTLHPMANKGVLFNLELADTHGS